MRPIVIAGGGTGGHIYPALAIADVLKKRGYKVIFIGSNRGLEAKILPPFGYELILLPIGPLNLSGIRFIKGVLLLPIAILMSFFYFFKIRPQLVLGVGGYASGPFVWVASFFTRTAIWEPNAYPGMTNRLLAKRADATFVVFDQAKKNLNSTRCSKVGLPVRSSIENISKSPHEGFHIFIFGGSQGAQKLNEIVSDMLIKYRKELADIKVVHQVGKRNFKQMQDKYSNGPEQVEVHAYIDNMAERYSWADLVICRAGVSSIAELAAAKTPAILVPLPTAADDHQRKNAESLAEVGAAVMLLQDQLDADGLWRQVCQLRDNKQQIEQMGQRIQGFHVKNASEKLTDLILSL